MGNGSKKSNSNSAADAIGTAAFLVSKEVAGILEGVLSPQEQREVRQRLLPRWQQLPPRRRQAIMERLHSLRDLSEAERQAKLNDPAFAEGLSPEDREMLGIAGPGKRNILRHNAQV